MLYWLLLGGSLALSVIALVRVRRLSRRCDRLSQAYWELRYEHDRLQARVDAREPAGQRPAPRQPPERAAAFVPLSSLRSGDRETA